MERRHPTRPGPNGVPYDVYEITFMGEAHDYPVSLSVAPGANSITLKLTAPPGGTAPPASLGGPLLEVEGNYGNPDIYPSIAMTSSGNFVMVWNQETYSTDNANLTYSLQYRTFQESTTTVGPLVTNWYEPSDGSSIEQTPGQTQPTQIAAAGGLQHLVVSFDQPMYNALDMVQTLTFAPPPRPCRGRSSCRWATASALR